jgi:cell division protein FtsQ
MTALAMTADDFNDDDLPQDDSTASRRWLTPLITAATALAALLLGAWLALEVSGADRIRVVQIEGEFKRTRSSEVEAAVRPFIETSLAGVELDAARRAVEELPWIARARVERVWPDRLHLRVWERVPFARWGEQQLLDSDNQVFAPQDITTLASLPLLSGGEGTEIEVADTYRRLAVRLADSPFALAGLARDARGEWTARTNSEIELRFGRGDPTLALDTLLGPAKQALQDRIVEVSYVDLRYTNGFSVGWRSPQLTQPKKSGVK